LNGDSKAFVPVHQVGEQGQVARGELVEARSEDVGDAAFVDEGGHLRLSHGELPAIHDLHVLHGIAVGEHAIFRLIPLNDVDELFAPLEAST
jgi:hypothetical protein